MSTLSPANDYPLYCKWVPSLHQMGILSAANDCRLSSKWVPCLLQMTTLSATFQMPTLFPVNGYPLCQISNDSLSLSLQNITFRVFLRRSTANFFFFFFFTGTATDWA